MYTQSSCDINKKEVVNVSFQNSYEVNSKEFCREFLEFVTQNKDLLVTESRAKKSDYKVINYQTYHKWANGHLKNIPQKRNITNAFRVVFGENNPSLWSKNLKGELRKWVNIFYPSEMQSYSIHDLDKNLNPSVYASLAITQAHCRSLVPEEKLVRDLATLKYLMGEDDPDNVPSELPKEIISLHESFSRNIIDDLVSKGICKRVDNNITITFNVKHIDSIKHHYNMKIIEAKKVLLHKFQRKADMSYAYNISLPKEKVLETLKEFRENIFDQCDKLEKIDESTQNAQFFRFTGGFFDLTLSNESYFGASGGLQ